MLRSKIALSMMDRSLSSDLEYFDNPSYYDKHLSAFRDSSAMTGIFWNALACVSAFVSFMAVFIILALTNSGMDTPFTGYFMPKLWQITKRSP